MTLFRSFIVLLALLAPFGAAAEQVYEAPEAFLARVFDGEVPPPSALWLDRAARSEAAKVLGHAPGQVRVRYWARGDRTAFILDEIGKEQPITTGVVVEDGAIRSVDVLVFRETRGWEVRHDFFTNQFRAARLAGDRLDRRIDGITGATLSVHAVTGVARLALWLDGRIHTANLAARP